MPRSEIATIRVPGRRVETIGVIGAYKDHRDGVVFVCETGTGGRGVAVSFSRDRQNVVSGSIYPSAMSAFLEARPGERFTYGMKTIRKLTLIEAEVLAGELLGKMIIMADEAEQVP